MRALGGAGVAEPLVMAYQVVALAPPARVAARHGAGRGGAAEAGREAAD